MRTLTRLIAAIFLVLIVFWVDRQFKYVSSTREPPWRSEELDIPLPVLYDGTPRGYPESKRNATAISTHPLSRPNHPRRPSVSDLVPSQFEAGQKAIPGIVTTPEVQVDGVVVLGKLSHEDTDWVLNELPEWDHAIYTVDDPNAQFTVSQNKGRESNVYLQYIIDNYYNLPSTIVFLHSHRGGWPLAWHNEFVDHSNVRAVQNLQIEFVQRNGYANLRCTLDPGCPEEIRPFREPVESRHPTEAIFSGAWKEIFGNDTSVPDVIATPCCAQFAISRTQVLERPWSSYVHYHRWIMETSLPDDISGRVMEYLWHIIFGQDPVYCPDFEMCLNDVYGMNLWDEWVL